VGFITATAKVDLKKLCSNYDVSEFDGLNIEQQQQKHEEPAAQLEQSRDEDEQRQTQTSTSPEVTEATPHIRLSFNALYYREGISLPL